METESNPLRRGYLITGGAAASALRRRGWRPRWPSRSYRDINAAGARAVANSIGETAMPITLDICLQGGWESALDECGSASGSLDVLVNNAAIVHRYARDVSLERQQSTDAGHQFHGPVAGMLAALPAL